MLGTPSDAEIKQQLKALEKEEQRIRLELEEREIRKELGSRSTFHYTKYTFRSYKNENWHHHLISDYLQKAVERKIKRLMIFSPPRHMKSENLERAFSYALGLDPDTKIMVIGHSSPKAEDISNHIKTNVTEQSHYDIFPNFPGINGKNTMKKWEIGNGYRGGLIASGRSGQITGSGFDLAGLDDLVKDREQAESPAYHEKNFDFYSSTFLSRQDSEESAIVIVNTRWNPKDISGRVVEIYGIKEYNGHKPERIIINENGDEEKITCPEYNGDPEGEYVILCLPAVMDEEFYQWKHPDDPREPGEALWPQRFSEKHLKQFMLNKHSWNSEWQQRPRPKGGNVINRAWFKMCKDFPRGGKLVRFWDLASTPKQDTKQHDPDFTAGALLTYVDSCVYIIDIVSTRVSPKQRYDLMKQTAEMDDRMYGSVMQVWEEEGGASGKDVTDFLLDLLADHMCAPFRTKKTKEFYIDTYVANKAENGNVYCVVGNRDEPGEYKGKWLIDKCDGNTFFDEAEMWPSKTSHDDRLDAVSKAAYILIAKIIKSLFGAETGKIDEYKPKGFDKETEEKDLFKIFEHQLKTLHKIDESQISDYEEAIYILEQLSNKYIELNDSTMAELILDEVDRIESIYKDKA
jgi:phage terminase large subunit-like protein